MASEVPRQPAFQVFTIVKREGQDDFWVNIGAAFPHADGSGFNVVLQALPLDGRLILRTPKSQDENSPRESGRRDNRDRRRDK